MILSNKTIAYIDGYNLYYGRLKGSPYKWLDIFKLFESCIIRPQLPDSHLVLVKYFTANVKAKFSSHGNQGVEMQNRYHRALKTIYPDKLQIIYGFHSAEEIEMPKYQDNGKVDKKDCYRVWRLNEKQTDVNIALNLYRDAIKQNAGNLIICSNDSDLIPALKAIRQDNPLIKLGVVFPRKSNITDPNTRPANKGLSELCDWTRSHINDNELASSQLPNIVPTGKKAIKKPDYW
jgi:uncharacterized LabA/DUF88 family protein